MRLDPDCSARRFGLDWALVW
uniref:Uncharacterized protein n=1 Tax=Arundo donax TaxID=35708 RepID=A0A0A9G6M7_ARUDO